MNKAYTYIFRHAGTVPMLHSERPLQNNRSYQE